MNVLHILNIADWALMSAGVAAALLMIIVGAGSEPPPENRTAASPDRRPRRPRS